MPLRWAARSIDSGLTARRRENASSWRVKPVPRATARRMASRMRSRCSAATLRSSSCKPLANTASRLLKSCATPPVSWPSDSIFCAWRSASSAFRRRSWSRRRSVTSYTNWYAPMRHAVAIAQRVVAHLVERGDPAPDPRTPRSSVNSSPASARLHTAFTAAWCSGCAASSSSMLSPTFGADAEDALELVGRRPVDGKPPVVEVGHLDEGIRAFHDVGEQLALGERLVDPALERLVQLAQARARPAPCRVVSETAQNIPATLPLSSRTGE